jgi:hypothetical protein
VLSSGSRRCLDQVAGLVLVALAATRAVHDDLGRLHGAFDPIAGGQVTGHELDSFPGLVGAPAEDTDLTAGIPEPGDEEAPEGPRPAGDENRTFLVCAHEDACLFPAFAVPMEGIRVVPLIARAATGGVGSETKGATWASIESW